MAFDGMRLHQIIKPSLPSISSQLSWEMKRGRVKFALFPQVVRQTRRRFSWQDCIKIARMSSPANMLFTAGREVHRLSLESKGFAVELLKQRKKQNRDMCRVIKTESLRLPLHRTA